MSCRGEARGGVVSEGGRVSRGVKDPFHALSNSNTCFLLLTSHLHTSFQPFHYPHPYRTFARLRNSCPFKEASGIPSAFRGSLHCR